MHVANAQLIEKKSKSTHLIEKNPSQQTSQTFILILSLNRNVRIIAKHRVIDVTFGFEFHLYNAVCFFLLSILHAALSSLFYTSEHWIHYNNCVCLHIACLILIKGGRELTYAHIRAGWKQQKQMLCQAARSLLPSCVRHFLLKRRGERGRETGGCVALSCRLLGFDICWSRSSTAHTNMKLKQITYTYDMFL